jgi:signal transduction histidine kinase
MRTQSTHPTAPDPGVDETRRFVDVCPVALVWTALDGEIVLANAAAATLLARLRREGEGENLFDLLGAADPALARDLRGRAGDVPPAFAGRRVRLESPHPSGVPRWIEIAAAPFEAGVAFSLEDVTATVDGEERFVALAAEEAQQRGRIEMSAGILHDLGNALTGVASHAADLRGRIADDRLARVARQLAEMLAPHAAGLDDLLGAGKGRALLDLLGAVVASSERGRADAARGIDRLLDLVVHSQELVGTRRDHASGASGGRGPREVYRILEDVRSLVAGGSERSVARVTVDCPPHLPLLVVDRTRFMQVLLNLARNSVEACAGAPAGATPCVVISARRAANGGLVVEVRDSGSGFRPELAEGFFAAGASTKGRGGGVGLATVRRIVDAFGGRVTLRSNGPGTGAVARVELPPEVFADASR